MVRISKRTMWVCDECNQSYDDKDEAEECCKEATTK